MPEPLSPADAPTLAPDDPLATLPPSGAASRPGDAATVPGFTLDGELGRGGMGVVYKARQLPLNRPVALKMVLGGAHADPRDLARFLAEAEAVAAVRHPHVVQVFEYGEHDGRPFFAMEFLDGGSLADRIKQRGRLSAVEAAAMVEKCCRGVQAAHDLGIVHRDLKPANILLDAAGEPKVTDFGLAKRGGTSDLTRTGAVMGTPAYMAPEQAKGEGKFVGPGADVYALGAILFECLAGQPPFQGTDPIALLMRVATEEAPPVRRFATDVPRDLELICRKCLAKLPHERYPTAGLLADDLGRHLRGEPIHARPTGTIERAAKWVRRNPVVATSAVVVLLALLAGAGVSVWQAVEARRAERQAQARLKQSEKANELALAVFRGLKPNEESENTSLEQTLGAQLAELSRQLDEQAVEDPLMLARMRDALGYGQLRLLKLDLARELFTQALRVRESELGDDHPDTVSSRDGLARVHLRQARHAEALPLFEKNLALREIDPGPGHPDTVATRRGLAEAMMVLGRKQEATRLFAENLRWMEAWLGEGHQRTNSARAELAQRLSIQGEYDQAAALLQVNLGHMRSKAPETKSFLGHDYHLMATQSSLADIYIKGGRPNEAIDLLSPQMKLFDEVLGPGNPSSSTTRDKLAEAYRAAGRHAEAIPLMEASLQATERMMGAVKGDDDMKMFAQLGLFHLRVELAKSYDRTGQADKARPLFALVERDLRAALASRTDGRSNPKDPAPKEAIEFFLATALVAQGKHVEAEPLLLSSYRSMLERPDRDSSKEKPEVVKALIEVYEAIGQPAKRAEWEAKLKELAGKGTPKK